MVRRTATALLFLMAMGVTAWAAELTVPYYGAKPGSLEKAKSRYISGDKDVVPAVKKLIADAEKALKLTPPSVMDKKKMPTSEDKHDYISLAPYFWPDPSKPNGLPYMRKDGETNPESRDETNDDSPRIARMGKAVETLALAYYFTKEDKYAEGAVKFVRVWFLNADTKMNPHLTYAQAIMGKNDGRGEGILEGRCLGDVIDAMSLLGRSRAWTEVEQKAFRSWMSAYYDWLMKSENGKDERSAKNNHGSWFDVQAVQIALCLGKKDEAKRILESAWKNRILVQIKSDGSQPLELARTKSFDYCSMNLDALATLANLGEHAGVDLWKKNLKEGKCLRKAIDFMVPYIDKPAKKWTYEQIKDANFVDKLHILRLASLAYGVPTYENILSKYDEASTARLQFLFMK
jgi:hypothetical protein